MVLGSTFYNGDHLEIANVGGIAHNGRCYVSKEVKKQRKVKGKQMDITPEEASTKQV